MIKVTYLPEAKKFISKLNPSLRLYVLSLIERLEEHGHLLRMPYSKALGSGLFELRILGDIQVRIFYCFHNNIAHLLSGIIKKGKKLPSRELGQAREMKRIVERQ
ncbi:MAG: type II toxin-antitoxin system RelE/ParE family toxin [bacterium]|nr:type II toxin-antitoxin system RelE/ParE family toxin [bacterium]